MTVKEQSCSMNCFKSPTTPTQYDSLFCKLEASHRMSVWFQEWPTRKRDVGKLPWADEKWKHS